MTNTDSESSAAADEPTLAAGGRRRPGATASVLLLLGVLVATVLAVGVARHRDSAPRVRPVNTSVDTAPQLHEVVYQVDGTATTADLTLATANGGTSQQAGIGLPIKNNAGGNGLVEHLSAGAFLYISAQNDGNGTITCHISVDGVEVISNTSSGQFAIVTCSGHL